MVAVEIYKIYKGRFTYIIEYWIFARSIRIFFFQEFIPV